AFELAPGGAPVTGLLIAVQVLTFMVGLYFAQREQIPLPDYLYRGTSPVLNRLAVSAVAVTAGEGWRLVSYCLVHIGALHLLLNISGHLVDGPAVERMFGSGRLLFLWVLAGLGGGCAVVLAGPGGAAGSSGAWCGLVGAEAAFIAL